MKKDWGISMCGLLTCIFIGLKLSGVINWSWFWVLSPLIFKGILYLIIGFIIFIMLIVMDEKDKL